MRFLLLLALLSSLVGLGYLWWSAAARGTTSSD